MKKRSILEMQRLSTEAFKNSEKTALTIVLDNIRSMHNIGSIFRTADAFLIEKIVLCGISSTPPNPEIHKTALGSEFSVDWEYHTDCLKVVENLKQEGYVVCAIEQAQNSISLEKLDLDTQKKYAIILGNEVHGVQQSLVDLCDSCIEIPQFGTKHSLNVSVAAGIVIWSFYNELNK